MSVNDVSERFQPVASGQMEILCRCWASVEQTETLFLLVLSTMYPYWTRAGPQSSLTGPRVSSCVRWLCPVLKSSRLTLTCCPVCASNNHGCDREPHLELLTLSPDLGSPAMCNFEPTWAVTWQERSSSTTESKQHTKLPKWWREDAINNLHWKKWQASCQFNLAHKLKELRMF